MAAVTYNNAAATALAVSAAKAVKQVTKRAVTIKDDGYALTLCIGYTNDATGDAAYEAAYNAAPAAMGGELQMAADISGHGVKTLMTV